MEIPQSKILAPADVKQWLSQQIIKQPGRDNVRNVRKKISVDKQPAPKTESTFHSSPRETEPKFALVLRETETIWLFTISSGYDDLSEVTVDEETIKQSAVASWKCLNAESQTTKNSEKSKNCETVDVRATNSFVNASAWDLYDTYAQIGSDVGFGIKEFQLLIDTALKTRGLASDVTRMPAEKQMKRLVKQDRFQYCVLVIERLLASKAFEKKQRLLKGQAKEKFETVTTCTFSYQVSLLWTYDNHFINPMTVTSFDWNPRNNILLAVGYGLLNAEEEDCGCICVWSPKNPCHPERKILVEHSVTTISFSKEKANILSAGCRNGDILLIDVAFTEPMIRLLPRSGVSVRYGPVWKIEWFTEVTAYGTQEKLLALGDSGCLTCYSCDFPTSRSNQHLLELDYTIGLEKDTQRKQVKTIYSSKTLSGLSFSLVPKRHICYIASKQGVVVKCTIRDPCSKAFFISAHLGPVSVVQHSPVCSRIFLTCGADHFLKIWMDAIPEPLLTLTSNLQKAMVCAQWSPTIPTMIASVTTTELIIWDIARKPTQPINTLTVRSVDLAFSTLQFFPDGMGLAVGDQQGHVKVYQLSELPRSPYLQVEALITAIRSALTSKQHLLYKFNKAIHFSSEETFTFIEQ